MGFESGVKPAASGDHGEATFGSGAASISFQNTTVHSGTYAMRVNTSATSAWINLQAPDSAGSGVSLYRSIRFFLRVASLPSANARLISVNGGSNESLYLNSDGTLSVARSTTKDATSVNTLSADGQWHAIELDTGWSSGNGRRVYVDGVEWASANTTAATAGTIVNIGIFDSCNSDVYFDDIVCEDSTLSSIWSNWKVTWMPVVSDNSRGTWTGGAGGTTNLYDALNNIPPVGVAAGSDTNTSQIQSASSSGTDAYDANIQDYTTHGIGAADTIRAVMGLVVHAEGVATGTKTGDIQIVSNPAAAARTFQYGRDIGAAATYVDNWAGAISQVTESPSVTLGTSPVIRVRKTDTGTRETHVCWLGMYIAWTVASGPVQDTPELRGRPFGLHGAQHIQQLLAQ